MADITNTFMGGRMEKDLDERLLPEGLYRDALNIDIDISEGANVGSARNKMGNTKIADLATISGQTIQNCRTIGAEKYERDNLIYWLVASDKFDGIYEYNEISGQTVRVLQSNKATPSTASKLNFNQQYIVTGINYINGFLYWTDNYNQPRKINIARAKSYLIDDARIVDDLNVILAPPLQAPTIVLSNDGSQSNNISEKFIYFSYRYKYIDGQYSAMSPFSAVSFTPNVFDLDYTNGSNKAMINKYNSADISFQTGGKNVKEIQLLMRDTRNLNVSIIESFNKDKLSLKDNYTHSFKFKNNKTYTVITSDQITRLFDNVPLLAKAQDFVGNRLMYGNYTQFYNITDCDGKDIKINLGLDFLSTSATINSPSETFRSDRDYEVGIVYLDSYGRSTTVLTSENNTVYIPSTKSITANSLKVSIKHKPPCWATNFRVVLKQSKGKYQTIFPLLYYVDGSYRHFLIQPSDRDKFAIGEYVIFKADANGPTLSNKKYKILDLENRDANFLPGGGQLAGLYFKIKVDSSSEFNGSNVSVISDTTEGSDYYGNTIYGLQPAFQPVYNQPSIAELPIHYGTGSADALTSTQYFTGQKDYRVTIEVTSPTTYRYTLDVSCAGGWVNNQPITSTLTPVYLNPSLTDSINISWNLQANIVVGDRWKINCRSNVDFAQNYFGGTGIPNGLTSASTYTGGYALFPAYASNVPTLDTPIYSGAVINITIKEDSRNGNAYTTSQQFISPARYANIEEWFVESGAYQQFISKDVNGTNVGAKSVSFRRGAFYSVSSRGNNPTFLAGQIDGAFNTTSYTDVRYAPLRMIVKGYGEGDNTLGNNKFNKFVVEFILQQTTNPAICETDPKEKDTDIYHEISKTYPIKNGLHKVYWDYADFTFGLNGATNLGQLVPGSAPSATDTPHNFSVGDTVYVASTNNTNMPSGSYTITSIPDCYNVVINLAFPGSAAVTAGKISYSSDDQDQGTSLTSIAVIKINNPTTKNSDYNAWTFGNGLESDRIYDDWNAPTLEYSPRTNSVVDEYKQKLSENAICYSGIYGINTSVNRLNEFNLSIANFKYLDKAFGAIQKLHSRDTDLLVFQYDKISKVLYGKNLLADAVGGGQVVSIPEVLGTQLAFPYENGISINPESFASNGEDLFVTDARRGTVLNVAGDSLVEINIGMNDYFRDLMRTSPNNQKLGAYDPHNQMYVLASNDLSVKPCELTISRNNLAVSNIQSESSRPIDLFSITSNTAWTLSVVSTGFGTNWVSGYATSGSGDQTISSNVAANTTGLNRTVNFVVTYCGQTVTFVLSQGRYKDINVVLIANANRQR
jgi:hypothetical protein